MNTKTICTMFAPMALAAVLAAPAAAQCPFDPTITGDLLVCPESSTLLSTQPYDTYQWYRRSFPNGTAMPIAGANGPTLDVGAYETPVYISVLATHNGCSEQSPEVLVDGLAFLPVTVLSEGTFDIGPEGELVICVGDTVSLVALQPYTLHHQWYDGPDPVAGANDDTLIVTQPGNYWLTASPTDCPDYTASLGVQIAVVWGDAPGCATTSVEQPAGGAAFEAVVLPNPAYSSFLVAVDVPGTVELRLVNMLGQVVRQAQFDITTEVFTHDLPTGTYTLVLQHASGRLVQQVVVRG